MLLRRKQNRNDDAPPVPNAWSWQTTERGASGRSKRRTTEFSKLSAQMVELSLQEAQRGQTLRGSTLENPSTASSPLLSPTDLQRITQLHGESSKRPKTVAPKTTIGAPTPLNAPQAHPTPPGVRLPNTTVLYSRATVILRGITNCWNKVPRALGSWLPRLRVTGSAALGNLRGCWNSVQKDQRLAAFRARILGRFTIAAQRIELLQQTEVLIGRWSTRTASTAKFLAERISAKLRIIRHSKALSGLRYACEKNLRVLTARAPAVREVIKKKLTAVRRYWD
jgi:hypothetical protein